MIVPADTVARRVRAMGIGAISAMCFAGCVSETTTDGPPVGSGGSGSSSTSGSAVSGSAVSGSAASGSGLPACPPPGSDSFPYLVLAGAPSGYVPFDAVIHRNGANVELDPCAPDDSTCTLTPAHFDSLGAGFVIALLGFPDGAFVHVERKATGFLLITNLPTLHGMTNPAASHTSVWLYVPAGNGYGAAGLPPDDFAEGFELTNALECTEALTDYTAPTLTNLLTGAQVQAGQGKHPVLDVASGPQKGSYALANGGVWAHGPDEAFGEAVIRLAP
jgi:hypothetical protein